MGKGCTSSVRVEICWDWGHAHACNRPPGDSRLLAACGTERYPGQGSHAFLRTLLPPARADMMSKALAETKPEEKPKK